MPLDGEKVLSALCSRTKVQKERAAGSQTVGHRESGVTDVPMSTEKGAPFFASSTSRPFIIQQFNLLRCDYIEAVAIGRSARGLPSAGVFIGQERIAKRENDQMNRSDRQGS